MRTPVPVAQGRNQAPRVDLKQGLGLLVRVDFDILVRNALELQSDPHALDKWTAEDGQQLHQAG